MAPDSTEAPLTLTLLGPCEVRLHGRPLPRLRSRKTLWLLALLALRHDRDVERSWLAGTLWPDSPEPQSFTSLRTSLTDLRRALGEEAGRLSSSTSHTLRLDLEGAAVDVIAFDAALARGDAASLEEAVLLYRGLLLEGCEEEWAFQERESREEAYLQAREQLAANCLAGGNAAGAVGHLRAAVSADPLRETAQRALMEALVASGNYAGAMEVYRELRDHLHREMNAEPDAETRAVYERIRAEARGRTASGHRPAAEAPHSTHHPATPQPSLSAGDDTLTFLFTDIVGSTRLWEAHREAMQEALARHDAILRAAIEENGGTVFKTGGDAFCAAFTTAAEAVAAALAAQRALWEEAWGELGSLRVRMALDTGAAEERGGDYFGPPLNRIARLLEAGHGGQILLALATQALTRDDLPERVSLRDLGPHRFRDLAQPEPVFQVLHPDLPADFPPLRSLDALPNNLPRQLTRFIGREREMVEVRRLLSTTPLLTLTGSGGCGKTRLALQVAADLLEEYPNGVWLAELAALSDTALVPQTVAAALGVREEPGRSMTDSLVEALRPKSLLLVLDNCEHLLTASAQLAEHLLQSCPKLRVLASSREGLGILGEQTYHVPSLSAPDPRHLPAVEHLLEFDAVRLFADRATLSQPCFVLSSANALAVAQVCQRLDGIPLAIELAAARVKALPVEKIAERLDDRFRLLTGGSRTALPRQQTLRATIDWSYDLLSELERMLLRRLSEFAGGWTLEAAEAVCADGSIAREVLVAEEELLVSTRDAQRSTLPLQECEILDLLTTLVAKSLVVYEGQGGEARYRMLETVRQYARDRLREAGEAPTVRDCHLCFFLRLVQEAGLRLMGKEQGAWLDRLEREHDNLHAAIEWSLEADERWQDGLALMRDLFTYWDLRSRFGRALEYLERFVARSADWPIEERAKLLRLTGFVAMKQADYPAARRYFEESRTLRRQQGVTQEDPRDLQCYGALALHVGDYAQAASLLQQGLRIYRGYQEAGTEFKSNALGLTLDILGLVAYSQGEFPSAHSYYEQSLNLFRETDDKAGIASALLGLGRVAMRQSEYSRARALLQESLSLLRGVKEKRSAAWALNCLAWIGWHEGEDAAARAHLVEALGLCRETGRYWETIDTLLSAGYLAQRQDQPVRAVRLFGAAEALRAAIGEAMPPVERAEYENAITAARAALGEQAFAAARTEGRALTLEAAVAYALEPERLTAGSDTG